MGAIDKFLNNLNLGNSANADDEYYDDYEEDEIEEQPKKFNKTVKNDNEDNRRFSKVTSIGKRKNDKVSYEINVVKPTSMEDSKQIVDSLIDNVAVLLNLTLVDVDLARRVLDFSLGSIYTINGSYQKITDTIFVFVPNGVDISGSISEDSSEN